MKTVISVKVDKNIRDGARKVAVKMGLPLSTIINSQLRQLIRDGSITFETEEAYTMSKKLERRLAPIEADIKSGRNLSAPLRTPDEIRRHFRTLAK